MGRDFKGSYPPDWPEISRRAKEAAGWCCERCGRAHDPAAGYTLTVHHLDGDKAECAPWNLAVLCQRCHLHIQAKVDMRQTYMWAHTPWMLPHVEGMLRAIEEAGP